MAKTLRTETVSEIFVTQGEMAAMLGQKAQAAGLLSFVPEEVDLLPSEDTDEADGVTRPGWRIIFRTAV